MFQELTECQQFSQELYMPNLDRTRIKKKKQKTFPELLITSKNIPTIAFKLEIAYLWSIAENVDWPLDF